MGVSTAGAATGSGVGSSEKKPPTGVSTRGGSKIAKLRKPGELDRKPVQSLFHSGSRSSNWGGGMMIGRYGGPYVAYVDPALVVRPTPKVGHARSAVMRGFAYPRNILPNTPLGSKYFSPIVKGNPAEYVETCPGGSAIIGFVKTEPIEPH